MHPNLSFEQAPPISVPFRFFLTAPWFGVAAGGLLVSSGGELFASRWIPETLAATHLLVVGFMLQAMCGALLQFVPVAAGGNVWRPRWVAGLVHPALIIAAGLLAMAFLTQRPALFRGAAHGFALVLGGFLLVLGHAVWRTAATGATIVSLRGAIIGLAFTASLGVLLALGLARGSDLSMLILTDIHAAWGLGGWALLLLAAVSYLVVPMFQLTPAYPSWFGRTFLHGLLVVLVLWTLQLFWQSALLRTVVLLLGLGLGGLFGAQTLILQARRRRKIGDTTLLFFRVAMLCLLLLPISAMLFLVVPAWGEDPRASIWFGVLAIVGVFVSAISGMLYKIVPFLNWLHLQRACGLRALPPTMNQMIPEQHARRQFHAHLLALLLLLAAVWFPGLARVAGVAFMFDCAWLGINLIGAVRVYLRFKSRIPAGASDS